MKKTLAFVLALAVGTLAAQPTQVLFFLRFELTDLNRLSPFPELKTYRMNGKWVHTPEFEDRYLSDRMRLQFWTLRYE